MSLKIDKFCYVPHSLEDFIQHDPFHLLSKDKLKSKNHQVETADDRVQATFKEIEAFINKYKRYPNKKVNTEEPKEHSLACKLEGLKERYPKLYQSLPQFNEHSNNENFKSENNISLLDSLISELEQTKQKSSSVHDDFSSIINDDPFDLLRDTASYADFADKPSVRQSIDSRSLDEEIQHIAPIKDFYRYKHCFDSIHQQLHHGSLKLQKIVGNSGKIEFGSIFIIKGILNLIVDGQIDEQGRKYKDGRDLYRVYQIFENGKGGWPTAQAVRSSFYKNQDLYTCYRIVPANAEGVTFLDYLKHDLEQMRSGHSAVPSGYIYILGSKSTNPVLRPYILQDRLVKIGYCTTSVQDRIKNCEHETTYLCAPVKILSVIKCFNFNPEQMEQIVHAFLAERRLNVRLIDHEHHEYEPREWFRVSQETAEKVIQHIMDNDLDKYHLDPILGRIVRN